MSHYGQSQQVDPTKPFGYIASAKAKDQSNVLVLQSIIQSNQTKKAVIKGLKNMIVIDEGDVLLIYPKDQEQEIKSVRNDLNDDSVL